MRSRLVATSALILTAALAGCSGSGSDGATSADAPGKGDSAAPTSSKKAAPSSKTSASDTSSGSGSSAPSTSSSDPTTSSSESSSSSSAGGSAAAAAPGKTVNKDQIVDIAKRVGCAKPAFQKASPTSPAAKVGTKGGVNCEAGGKGYIIAQVKPGTGPKATAMSLKKAAKGASVPYLHGDNWALFAVADAKAKTATFDSAIIKDAQRKVGGGEVATV